jgi:hypothetical protein
MSNNRVASVPGACWAPDRAIFPGRLEHSCDAASECESQSLCSDRYVMYAGDSRGELHDQISGMTKSFLTAFVALSLILAGSPSAQMAAVDPSDRLREVLPADVAGRVLATIAEARARSLPAQALANRALKFAARGVAPADIERSVADHVVRLEQAREAIQRGRGAQAAGDEIDAGAEALRLGATGASVSDLAKGAPSGRSLTVPLFVLGSLVDRGLPSDAALQRVLERLQARASDADLEQLPAQAGSGRATGAAKAGEAKGKAQKGRPEGAGAKSRPAGAGGGRPASIPASPGKGTRPESPPGKQQ